MKLMCDKSSLQDAVSKVSRAVSPKSTIKAIEGILIRASRSEGLYLCAYNLDMGITCTVDAAVKEEGAIVIHPCRVFVDIVRRLPGETVSIEVSANYEVQINCGSAKFTVSGIDASEFPELPDFECENSLTMPNGALRSMITQTRFAISDNIMHPVYTGARFEMETDCLRVVALDGFRIAIRTEPYGNSQPCNFVVPMKTLAEAEKMLDDSDNDVQIMVAKRFVMFCIGNFTILSRVIEGQFIDYRAVINLVPEVEATINTGRMIDGAERMALMLSAGFNTPVRCFFGDGRIKLECHSELGTAIDEWDEEIEFDTREIWFKNQYILDAFRAADTDKVIIQLGHSENPMKILPSEGDSFEFYLMPVRQKKGAR